ncbi:MULTISPECIES: hypothetical protein [Methylorubrum]|uniref:hypothetical protein n=1 Tax=Methylorubrum TaxID=2282523 RepID=UPI00209D9C51|nr:MULTISPECIES: hypothetical protein [Methylorubrum]MCP1551677.1 hypothetical protein [Methylorubrum zatmanii]MCP1556636.1 hypothetical protein [Methylorubrum extorquens]MCP1581725.1 hypothetical protein [Methylorubrum extorquens]
MNGKTNHGSTKPVKQQPTHDVKVKRTNGEHTSWERIGAGWQRDDGSVYVRLIGTQIVSDGFTIYPVEVAQ